MKLLEYAWSTFSSVSGTDQEKFRLILSETAQRPTLGLDDSGYIAKVPLPRREKEGVFSVQGLYSDAEDQGWHVLWRLFRASLYHAAFHVLYSDMKLYSKWAKGRDQFQAIYAISLLEDYRITMAAREQWPGALGDIAYANYIGGLRMSETEEMESRALRFASKLLLALWGVSPQTTMRGDEDKQVLEVAEKVRGMVESSLGDPKGPLLLKAADLVYGSFEGRSVLPQVPAFPHTEAHSGDSLFEDHIAESKGREEPRLRGAMSALGISSVGSGDAAGRAEFEEAYEAVIGAEANSKKIKEFYAKISEGTRMKEVSFPVGDYSSFLRTRAELAGPIRNIKNQIMQVQNSTDEERGKGRRQVEGSMAMQVLASGVQRPDLSKELVQKDEAWAILVDACKIVANSPMQIKGVSTCLAEIANSLMPLTSKWGLFGLDDSFMVVKDFDEDYGTEAKARIGGLGQKGGDRLPDAVAVAARSLELRPTENRHLVIVSDCLTPGHEGREDDLVSRLTGIRKKGIVMLGIGIENSAVKKYFKSFSALTTPYEMMKDFVRNYLELSASI